MKVSIAIETERLLIRSYRLSDAPALFNLVSLEKKRLQDYFPRTVESNQSLLGTLGFIKNSLTESREGKSAFSGIFEKGSGKLIGQISMKDINWRVPKCELGYFIVLPSCKKGYASEALHAVSDYCFTGLRMAKIFVRIEDINKASKKVAEKCGFSVSGVLRNDFRATDGRLMHCEIWERI